MAKTKGRFTVEIETENLAAWMAINNTFAWDRQEDISDKKRYWSGVLIQLGQYEKWEDNKPMQGFETIKFLSNGQVVHSIGKDAFADPAKPTWINVVVRDQKSKLKDPMARKHLRDLKLTPPEKLDRYLAPTAGGITLWSENGYELEAKNNKEHVPHKTYVFTTPEADEYEAEIYLKGAEHPGQHVAFDKLMICEPESDDDHTHSMGHGSHNSPPNEP